MNFSPAVDQASPAAFAAGSEVSTADLTFARIFLYESGPGADATESRSLMILASYGSSVNFNWDI